MFVTVVAVLCHLGGPAADSCVEEIVTDSNMTPDITIQECMKGGAGAACEVDGRTSALSFKLANRTLQMRAGSL
jgi:hypothetical protein